MSDPIENLATLLFGDDAAGVAKINGLLGPLGLKQQDIIRATKFVTEHETDNSHSSFTLTVPGDPPVAKRPRASRIKNKAGLTTGIRMHAADAGEQRTMRSEVAARLPAGHIPFAGEVEMSLDVYRPMLASWSPYKQLLAELGYIRPDRRPDWDNYAKLTTDAMRGVVFVDDSLVVVGVVSIKYSRSPRIEITVSGRARSISR